jgi:hypothetical protein
MPFYLADVYDPLPIGLGHELDVPAMSEPVLGFDPFLLSIAHPGGVDRGRVIRQEHYRNKIEIR